MVGPVLGGVLSKLHGHATLAAVLGCYALTFIVILLYFDKHVTRAAGSRAE